jgi:hypothetical protein
LWGDICWYGEGETDDVRGALDVRGKGKGPELTFVSWARHTGVPVVIPGLPYICGGAGLLTFGFEAAVTFPPVASG